MEGSCLSIDPGISRPRFQELLKAFTEDVQEESRYTIPEFTCPATDRVLEGINELQEKFSFLRLENAIDEKELASAVKTLNSMHRGMEALRTANETLRLRGKGWKNLCKSMIDRMKGLDVYS